MDQSAIVLFWTLIGLAIGQAAQAAAFVRVLWRFRRARLADDRCPSAAVVMCLRGADPFLADGIAALLTQDYPAYRVIVVVDRRDDAAWRVAEEAVARAGAANVTIEPLSARQDTCSLKCSSLVQAVSSLDPSVEIVAELDADTVPHRTWLRELAAALSGDRVGAATGHRWYMPVRPTLGSLVRCLWNAAAVAHMYVSSVPWGGTLALKTRVIRETGLLDRWSHAFCEDTMLFARLRRHGYQVRFVPSLMMVNRETCDVPEFYRWVSRQLLTARLYHPYWPAALAYGLLATVLPFAAVVLFAASAARRDMAALLWSGGGFVLYQLALFPMVFAMEVAVRRILASRYEGKRWLSAVAALKMLASLPVSQAVSLGALVSAARLRHVEWRGVSYQVDGPWKIRLMKYEPAAPASEENVKSL